MLLPVLRLMWRQWLQALHCTALHCGGRLMATQNGRLSSRRSARAELYGKAALDALTERNRMCVLAQVFQLCPFPNNAGYWVLNDMFRLNIG